VADKPSEQAANVPNQKFGHFKFWPPIQNLNQFQQSK
jgi:hypothetical protein